MRLAAIMMVFVGTLLHAEAALACQLSLIDKSHIVGFDEDGGFVEYYRRDDYAREDLRDEYFTLYDKSGVEQSRLTLTAEGEGYGLRWKRTGSSFFRGLADGLGGDDAKRLEEAIVKAKKLTMVSKPRKIRHVKSETECGSIELKTRDGWLRIAEADLLGHDNCIGFSISAFEHEKTSLVFVRLKIQYGHGVGDSLHSADIVQTIAKQRIDGIALALRGERARLKGDLDEAITALEASIDAVPEYLPSRISLIRAYAKAGRKAAPLLARLRRPIAGSESFIGSAPDSDLVASLFKKAWPAAKLPESFPWHEDRSRPITLASPFY